MVIHLCQRKPHLDDWLTNDNLDLKALNGERMICRETTYILIPSIVIYVYNDNKVNPFS